MYNISRFLPSFGDLQPASIPNQRSAAVEDVAEDDLLGLQRLMRDAQNPRRPVIGEVTLNLRSL